MIKKKIVGMDMGAPKRGVSRYGADIGFAIRIGKGQEMRVKSLDIYFDQSSGNRFGRAAKMSLQGVGREGGRVGGGGV